MRNKDVRDVSRRTASRPLRSGGDARVPGADGPQEPLGLTARLRGELGRPEPDGLEIREQSIVGTLLELAVRGNPRAVQEIWSRIEGRPGDRPASPPIAIDDATARKILEAALDDDDELPQA
jgi:hypothetical protein